MPTCVEHGAADVGITGKDTLLEYGGDGFYEPLDLGIARCRLMTAGPGGRRRPAPAAGSPARGHEVPAMSPGATTPAAASRSI